MFTEEEKMAHYAQEEKHIREENLRLQRRLQMEMERREALCRHLSESESRYLKSILFLSYPITIFGTSTAFSDFHLVWKWKKSAIITN